MLTSAEQECANYDFTDFCANITMNQPLGKVSAFYMAHLAGFFIFLNAVVI